jgi:hypothetical protein
MTTVPEIGQVVTVRGVRGEYKVRSLWTEPDGTVTVTVWGGDRNPLGHRSFRSFPLADLKWKRTRETRT